MNDLVKLKCDYFDSIIKEFTDNLNYISEDDRYTLSNEERSILIYDVDNFFIVKDKKKYSSEINYDIFDDFGFMSYDFIAEKENANLEDGIYYKGLKVSDL